MNPKIDELYNTRGEIKMNMNDLEGAIKDFNKCLSINPKNNDAYLNLGDAKLRSKDMTDACKFWNKAASLNNEDAKSLLIKYCK